MTTKEAIGRIQDHIHIHSKKEPITPFLDEAFNMAIEALKRPHGECNQCRYYEGVHGVLGHAPCSFWKIGGVLWNDYCFRFERSEWNET